MYTSANMLLQVPQIGADNDPAWQSEIIADLVTIDAHQHGGTDGAKIPFNNLNFTSATPSMGGAPLTNVGYLNLAQTSAAPTPASSGTVWVDTAQALWYRSPVGNILISTSTALQTAATGVNGFFGGYPASAGAYFTTASGMQLPGPSSRATNQFIFSATSAPTPASIGYGMYAGQYYASYTSTSTANATRPAFIVMASDYSYSTSGGFYPLVNDGGITTGGVAAELVALPKLSYAGLTSSGIFALQSTVVATYGGTGTVAARQAVVYAWFTNPYFYGIGPTFGGSTGSTGWDVSGAMPFIHVWNNNPQSKGHTFQGPNALGGLGAGNGPDLDTNYHYTVFHGNQAGLNKPRSAVNYYGALIGGDRGILLPSGTSGVGLGYGLQFNTFLANALFTTGGIMTGGTTASSAYSWVVSVQHYATDSSTLAGGFRIGLARPDNTNNTTAGSNHLFDMAAVPTIAGSITSNVNVSIGGPLSIARGALGPGLGPTTSWFYVGGVIGNTVFGTSVIPDSANFRNLGTTAAYWAYMMANTTATNNIQTINGTGALTLVNQLVGTKITLSNDVTPVTGSAQLGQNNVILAWASAPSGGNGNISGGFNFGAYSWTNNECDLTYGTALSTTDNVIVATGVGSGSLAFVMAATTGGCKIATSISGSAATSAFHVCAMGRP
jgi:hypothetical protein